MQEHLLQTRAFDMEAGDRTGRGGAIEHLQRCLGFDALIATFALDHQHRLRSVGTQQAGHRVDREHATLVDDGDAVAQTLDLCVV